MRIPPLRRLAFMVSILALVWLLLIFNMLLSTSPEKESENLKEEILALSKKYVRTLAKDSQNAIDGPYNGRLTGYDLKKTMAVLLEDMMQRLDRIEKRLNAANGTALNDGRYEPMGHHIAPRETKGELLKEDDKPVAARDLLLGVQEDCSLTAEEETLFPDCHPKLAWMRNHWKSDECYAHYGVDGSECSFRIYLSEIESWCPVLEGRKHRLFNTTREEIGTREAKLNFNLKGLFDLLRDPGQRHNYDWMKLRIERMWPNWVKAAKSLSFKSDLSKRPQQRVLVHLGLLSQKSGFKIPETSFKGGPLGELVQWSDIISTLYILGHDLMITSEVEQLSQILVKFPSAEAQCQSRATLPLDLLYTDIVGLTQFKRKVKHGYGKFSCLLRIIDSFGTEPAYNLDYYAKSHRLKTQWGMQNLNTQQFFTMFPHSPDNSFMGFVVENYLSNSTLHTSVRKPQAVVYGKAEYMWQGKEAYLSVIHKHASIHSTVFLENRADSVVPSFVENHGIMTGVDLHALLKESKLFIGLGFPYEGPAPLEAIALGCTYINPKFDPPHNSENVKFFRGKPTSRKVTSQHPYAEDFIGPPNVITVDMNDHAAVEKAVRTALEGQPPQPYMPYEFTEEGMLQRVNAYILHQNFCSRETKLWPPESDVEIVESAAGQSCKDACRHRDLICEPSHFNRINTLGALSQHTSCSSITTKDDIYYPAWEEASRVCILQKERLLFSCVGALTDLKRLCPCRNYIKGQTALCNHCLS